MPTVFSDTEGNTCATVIARQHRTRRSQRPQACMDIHYTRHGRSHGPSRSIAPGSVRKIRKEHSRDERPWEAGQTHNTEKACEQIHAAYLAIKSKTSADVDGVTWYTYGDKWDENLKELSKKLQRGAYHVQPVKRVYLPKADGLQRTISIPALGHKIVQRATAEVLNAVYEAEFKGFSYGFRPGRSRHLS